MDGSLGAGAGNPALVLEGCRRNGDTGGSGRGADKLEKGFCELGMTPESGYRFDIFLRYHRAQARWTRQLAERLDREGFRVWFDGWMLSPGSDRKLEYQLAIDQCRWIGIVISPELVGDPWPKDELYTGFAHAPARQNQRLLPLIHTPADLPRPLQDLTAIDFTGSEEDPVLLEFQTLQLMAVLDPTIQPPTNLQRFRLETGRSQPIQDEELRGFQAFFRSLQMALFGAATSQRSPTAEGMQQVAILQFLQRLFQWNSADLQYDKAEDWLRRGNLNEALAAFDRALNMDPNFALAWSRRGDVLVQLARYREAIDSYNGSLTINPYDETTRIRLALILGRVGKPKSAVVNYDKVLEINPEEGLAWHNRGIRLLQMKRTKLAVVSLNKALRVGQQHPKIWAARGIALRRVKRPRAAAESFAEALKRDPSNIKLWRWQGNAWVKANRYKTALNCYRRALSGRRRDLVTLYNLGVLLLRMGRYRQASDSFDRVLKRDPDHFRAWQARGIAFQRLGFQKEACFHFEEALKINPAYFPAQYALAVGRQALGQVKPALNQFNQILQQRPQNFACLYGRITCLRALRQWDLAQTTAEKMVALNGEDPWGWFALGLIASDQQHFEQAIQHYSQVLRLTPQDSTALNNRAWSLCQQQCFEDALLDAQQAVTLNPESWASWHTLACAQEGLGLISEAQTSYQQALTLNPDFAEAAQALARLQPTPMPDLGSLTPNSEVVT
ncbi:MAG: tetratricopeptide repeat protein [Cyanobacteriota bacterium]|nr:tetratricopeptide repeat protein [Cyanobacteriota bacterium]